MTTYTQTHVRLGNVAGGADLWTGTDDPSVAPGVVGELSSLYFKNDTGDIYRKYGAADTDWELWASASGSAGDGVYLDGDDGDVTDNANRTLDRVYMYNNWTVQGGAIITPARWPVFVKGTLTLDNGFIREDGAAGVGQAAGGTGGGAGATGSLGVGASGGNGGGGGAGGAPGATGLNQPRSIGTRSNGGAGGLSGAGGASGAGGVGTLAVATLGPPLMAASGLGFYAWSLGASPMGGGSGGGGGGGGAATGGKGGGGGGVVVVVAKNIIVRNGGAIQARGGAGAAGVAGNGGGGGGGGGGKALLINRSYSGTAPDVSGGAGGPGQGTGAAGTAGNAGYYTRLVM